MDPSDQLNGAMSRAALGGNNDDTKLPNSDLNYRDLDVKEIRKRLNLNGPSDLEGWNHDYMIKALENIEANGSMDNNYHDNYPFRAQLSFTTTEINEPLSEKILRAKLTRGSFHLHSERMHPLRSGKPNWKKRGRIMEPGSNTMVFHIFMVRQSALMKSSFIVYYWTTLFVCLRIQN